MQSYSSCSFHVYSVPPEVTVTMKDLSAPEGADVEFTCGYYGDPIPTVTWFKGTCSMCYIVNHCFLKFP